MTDTIFKQFQDLKQKHPDAVLLFRCGDFYETYEDDAEVVARDLGITLTKSSKDGSRMAGFPHHALDTYLPRLIRKGHRVAICDQLEDPKLTKKLVKRGITELVTPQPKQKPYSLVLPKLTKQQYDLLCECIRYRSADNSKERADALRAGQFTGWYDDMEKQLSELKTLIYDKTAHDTY